MFVFVKEVQRSAVFTVKILTENLLHLHNQIGHPRFQKQKMNSFSLATAIFKIEKF